MEGLVARGLPPRLAARVRGTAALWLVVTHPDDVRRMHVADLRGAYHFGALDLHELRALHAAFHQPPPPPPPPAPTPAAVRSDHEPTAAPRDRDPPAPSSSSDVAPVEGAATAATPLVFDNDGDGAKAAWLAQLEARACSEMMFALHRVALRYAAL